MQSHHVFDEMLEVIKRADETFISSFAINEAYVRRIIRNRDVLGHVTLVLDFTVASRHARKTNYAGHNVDQLLLTNNHSKIIYMANHLDKVLSISSNNATNNQRYECGLLLRNHPAIDDFLYQINKMKHLAAPWTTG